VHVEYRILGPLDVVVDGRAVALGGRYQRALLALLLADANEVVPVDRLIDGCGTRRRRTRRPTSSRATCRTCASCSGGAGAPSLGEWVGGSTVTAVAERSLEDR
jgi:hypothetical protein